MASSEDIGYILVGGFNPSEKYENPVGMMTFPTEWKNKSNVPNHQAGFNAVLNGKFIGSRIYRLGLWGEANMTMENHHVV